MLNLFILLLHLIFLGYIFYKKYKAEGTKVAFLNMALIGILFAVGWTIANTIGRPINELLDIYTIKERQLTAQTKVKDYFDDASIPLIMTTLMEVLFYKLYYNDVWNKKSDK